MPNTSKLQCDICGFLVETPKGLSMHKQFKHGVAPRRKSEHTDRSFGDIAVERQLDKRLDEVIVKLHDPNTAELTEFSDEMLLAWVHENALEQLRCDLEALAKRTVDQCSAIIKQLTELNRVCEALKAAQGAADNENTRLSDDLKRLNMRQIHLAQQANSIDKHGVQSR